MQKGLNLLLALTTLCGLSFADAAIAQDSAAGGAPAAGGSTQAAPASKPKRQRRLGKRLRNLRNRMHKKKAAGNGGAAPAQATPQQ
jgi:hypothetical protein